MVIPSSNSHSQYPHYPHIPFSSSSLSSNPPVPYQPVQIPSWTLPNNRIPSSTYGGGAGGGGGGAWPAGLPMLPIPPSVPNPPQLHGRGPPKLPPAVPHSARKEEVHIPGLEEAMNKIHLSQARNRHHSSPSSPSLSSPYRHDRPGLREKPLPPVPHASSSISNILQRKTESPRLALRSHVNVLSPSHGQLQSPTGNLPQSHGRDHDPHSVTYDTPTAHIPDTPTKQVHGNQTNTTYNIHVHLPSPPPPSSHSAATKSYNPRPPTSGNGRQTFEPDSRTMYRVRVDEVGNGSSGRSQSAPETHTLSQKVETPHRLTPPSHHRVPGSFPSIASPSSPNPATPTRSQQRKHTSSLPPFHSPALTSSPSPTSTSTRCSGFTQKGEPCKRLVRASSPYALLGINSSATPTPRGDSRFEEEEQGREMRRYCKDHAAQICGVEGFYLRNKMNDHGKWVVFDHWVPADLDEQTKVLLRLTMESPLTAKESRGFIYAYELRDLSTKELAYFKVGRTDNVPRRMEEWRKQCSTHHPTLRDIFPSHGGNKRHEHGINNSMLPGAMKKGEDGLWGVKRLERLIHIELAARSPLATIKDRNPCSDCSTIHREIFPITRRVGNNQGGEYEVVVRSVVERWVGFVVTVMGDG